MEQWYDNVRENWKELLGDRKFLIKFVLNFIVCYSIYMLLVQFLLWNRLRPGAVIDDPIQHLFTPFDFSFPTFLLTYICIISIIVHLLSRPRVLYYGLRAFTAVFVARAALIYLVPLAPPPQTILLKDPFLDAFIWGNQPITNDLFFSGHVADICIFIFLCRSNSLRYFMMACAIAVAVMVVWQYVHYTADVVAAPFFAYGAYMVFAKAYIKEESVVFSLTHAGQKILSTLISRER